MTELHTPDACTGHACVIHAPSDHHMRGWGVRWRPDRALTERICAHGVGHPDPDDLAWQLSKGRDWQAIHGCDGCCVR